MITGQPYGNVSLCLGPEQAAKGEPELLDLGQLEYQGMKIYYSGPAYAMINAPVNGVATPNDPGYEILIIDEAKEELILGVDGNANSRCFMKATWGGPDFRDPATADGEEAAEAMGVIDIKTQGKAQKAPVTIDNEIVTKDKIRAHLGALQNRLENTVSNLSIQAETLQASESRISDADISLEMMEFVRSQVLTQSAVAMLGQANSYPHMLMQLLG